MPTLVRQLPGPRAELEDARIARLCTSQPCAEHEEVGIDRRGHALTFARFARRLSMRAVKSASMQAASQGGKDRRLADLAIASVEPVINLKTAEALGHGPAVAVWPCPRGDRKTAISD